MVTTGHLGYLTIWPTGEGQPIVSTMNSPDGRTKANAAIVPAGSNSGSVSVYVSDTTNVILDIDGYFATGGSSTLEFYPLTPCRVVDTRGPDGDLGGPYLQGQQVRSFPVLESDCQIPSSAEAYSMNFTVLPKGSRVGYLTVWPSGETQPAVSTLNDPTGTNVANAALVPAGTGGAISTYVTDDTDLLIDVDGYFGPAGCGRVVVLCADALPRARHTQWRRPVQRGADDQRADQSVRTSGNRAGLCLQRDRASARPAVLPDAVA